MQSLPLYPDLESVATAASACQACVRATTRRTVVFGHGNPHARMMLVGEAPSETDDATGKPYTGPAGNLLDEALAAAGISRDDIWITNTVRCYAGRERNGRIENRPAAAREIASCKVWMDLELQMVNPQVILTVGAPAAKTLIHPEFRLREQRGQTEKRADGRLIVATIQPAYVMRLTSLVDQQASDEARALFNADVRLAVALSERE